jgi:hypothetical protein
LGYLSLGKKHSEHLVLKDGPQVLRINARRHPKQTLLIKTAVRAKDMAKRVKPQKIPKRLDGNDRSRDRTPWWDRSLEKHPQGLSSTTTQFRKKRAVIEKIAPKDLGNAEDKMAVGNIF